MLDWVMDSYIYRYRSPWLSRTDWARGKVTLDQAFTYLFQVFYCGRSEYFKSLESFYSISAGSEDENKVVRIPLKEISANVFSFITAFIYTSEVTVSLGCVSSTWKPILYSWVEIWGAPGGTPVMASIQHIQVKGCAHSYLSYKTKMFCKLNKNPTIWRHFCHVW